MKMQVLSVLLLVLAREAGAAGVDNVSMISTEVVGSELRFAYNGIGISPWHDIPFQAKEDQEFLLNFVCEIPLGTRQKMEIHKSVKGNPVIQDIFKDGSPRYYKYSASIVNYGAIPQTWEDPNRADPDTGLGGDNDPIDVLQLNDAPCIRGAVQRVRVLGALALIDDGETDWKLLVVHVDDAHSPQNIYQNLTDIPTDRIAQVTEWFRVYKVVEGKPLNKFAFNDLPVDAEHVRILLFGFGFELSFFLRTQALRVAKQTYEHSSCIPL